MKNLILSAIFAVVAFAGNTQIVTITGFGLSTTFGPITPDNTFKNILLDTASYLPYDGLPNGYKYVVDFNNKQCAFYDGNGMLVDAGPFKVLNKKSNRDFQIEFDENLEDRYGIIVKDNAAAHVQFNGQSCFMYVFDALYIY